MDDIIGKYLETVDDKFRIIILSDHGHGMRPTQLVNVNEILRKYGYLSPNIKSNFYSISPLKKKETLKKILAKTIEVLGIGNIGLKMVNKFPGIINLFSTPNYIRHQVIF
jgi:hypothetical protein